MNNDSDMAAPVTRAEIATTIAETEGRLRSEIVATRNELAATENRLRGEIATTRDELRGEIAASETRILTELARHANAIMENNQTSITVIDEQYRGLPERVKRLEEHVFAPKPKRSRRVAR